MCAYCRGSFHRNLLTKDHIPPQGVYGKEWRRGKILPWVDCCQKCREGQAKGDEALKAMVGMGLVRNDSSDSVQRDVMRSLNRQTWWRKIMIDSIQKNGMSQLSIDGLIGTRIILGTEFSNSAEDSICRTSRGLLFLRHQSIDTREFIFETFQYTEDQVATVKSLIRMLTDQEAAPPYRLKIEDAFFAVWWFAGNPINTGIMLQNYFGGLNFFVFFYHRDHPPTTKR
jgi:hypothetical protein